MRSPNRCARIRPGVPTSCTLPCPGSSSAFATGSRRHSARYSIDMPSCAISSSCSTLAWRRAWECCATTSCCRPTTGRRSTTSTSAPGCASTGPPSAPYTRRSSTRFTGSSSPSTPTWAPGSPCMTRFASASRTRAAPSGRCRPGWARRFSRRCTRCSGSAACASSFSTASMRCASRQARDGSVASRWAARRRSRAAASTIR